MWTVVYTAQDKEVSDNMCNALRDKHRRLQKAACQRVGNTVMLISVGILTPLAYLSVLLLPSLSFVPLLPISSHSVLTLFCSQTRN